MSSNILPGLTLLAVLTVFGQPAVPPALAATGDLDPRFADRGRLASINDAPGAVRFVASLESGGAILGGGHFHASGSLINLDGMGCTFRAQARSFVTQIDERGALDPTFGAVTLPDIEALGMARQADGKIVGIGHTVKLVSSFRCTHSFTPTVFRLNSDGSLDAAFGLNGTRQWHYINTLRALALDSKGRIVMAGTRVVNDDDPATPGRLVLAVMRLRPDGKVDRTFGEGGYFFGPQIDRTLSAYFRGRYDELDKISLVRTGTDGLRIAMQSGGACRIVGVTADGLTDVDFGSNGITVVLTAKGARVACHALTSDPDGRLVVAGNAREHGFLGRLLASGEPDAAFVADPAFSRSMSRVTSVAIAAEGKLLAAGTGSRGTAVIRLQPNGELDPAFGDAGRTWIDLDVETGPAPTVYEMITGEEGAVMAAGRRAYWDPPYAGSGAPFVVRLLGDAGGTSRGILSFSKWNVALQESAGKAILRVRRSGGSDGEVSARYHTSAELEASEQEDFVPRSGRLHWATGDRSERAIVIDIAGENTAPEYLESFRVVLEDARGGAGLGRRWATVDIQPDGSPGGQIEIVNDYGGLEAGEGGVGQIQLRRSFYFAGRVCATLVARSGSAIAGKDFRSKPTTVCWEDQEFEDDRLVNLKIIDDDANEGTETFTVSLVNPTGGAIIGPSGSASVLVYDND